MRWTGSAATAQAARSPSFPPPARSPGSSCATDRADRWCCRCPTPATAEAGPVALDGRMQYGVYPSHWRFVRTLGAFGVFANTRARGWAWATDAGGGVRRARAPRWPPPAPRPDGDQTITVRTATPVDLVRSMSFTPGLARHRPFPRAGEPESGATTTPRRHRRRLGPAGGRCPAGDWAVAFTYRPSSAVAALVVSARRPRSGARMVVVDPGWSSPAVGDGARECRPRGAGGFSRVRGSPMASAARRVGGAWPPPRPWPPPPP